ncbi:hypothetical protein CVT25_014472 [Psilocybe cyanescens]|uniref:Uncharacterized protein n=1 Tax=Psilocybe cyanescens TaxID=93625 RepID=A0A409XR97_PSICY|nr:hypothetical protein CVT25_014472 [Psilocybe cyanescens]
MATDCTCQNACSACGPQGTGSPWCSALAKATPTLAAAPPATSHATALKHLGFDAVDSDRTL